MAITTPKAKLTPIPPLRLIEDTATAIIVSINTDAGKLHFLYNTTLYRLILDEPRTSSRAMKRVNSLYVKVSATYFGGVKSSKSKLKRVSF